MQQSYLHIEILNTHSPIGSEVLVGHVACMS